MRNSLFHPTRLSKNLKTKPSMTKIRTDMNHSAYQIHPIFSPSPPPSPSPAPTHPTKPPRTTTPHYGLHPLPSEPLQQQQQQQLFPPRPQIPTSASRPNTPRLRHLRGCESAVPAVMRRGMHGDEAEQFEIEMESGESSGQAFVGGL